MFISRNTWVVLISVVIGVVLSTTVFRTASRSAVFDQQNARQVKPLSHEESLKRYPIADFDEPEPADLAKRAALKQRKVRNNDIIFAIPSASDGAIAWLPEGDFDFPALPIDQSDTVLVGTVLSAKAHASENKRSVFSEFEVTVETVLKAKNVTAPNVIIVEQTGGFLKYPDGRRVLFFIPGHGMPAVGTRNVFFLRNVGQGFRILITYELAPDGVLPLDGARQFERFRGEDEDTFLKTLREAITNSKPQ